MTSANAEKLFQKISHFVDESNALVKQGEFVDLKKIRVDVEELCKDILALNETDRTEYAEKLEQIVLSLQQLQESLIVAKDAVTVQLSASSKHKKANIAYQKTETSDNKK